MPHSVTETAAGASFMVGMCIACGGVAAVSFYENTSGIFIPYTRVMKGIM